MTAPYPKYAVIDLGTNTFHMLIVEVMPNGRFEELYRNRFFIKLAEGGITRIGAGPWKRGLQAIQHCKETLDHFGVSKVQAFGTAALRTAENGAEFIRQVKELSGIEVKVISGNEEARLIHQGVIQAVPLQKNKGLIMDIGGGSVEFIIADRQKVYWAQSFPLGVAVLYRQFHRHEPITSAEIAELRQFFFSELKPLMTALAEHKTPLLIGASGTFDVLENALVQHKSDPYHACLRVDDFFPFYEELVACDLSKRLARQDIPESRADMMIVALILIHFVIEKAQTQQIIISAYAMKEGMLTEMIRSHLYKF